MTLEGENSRGDGMGEFSRRIAVIELESKARGRRERERNLWEMREKCSSTGVSSDGAD